jgi:hypothetical protein
LLFLAALGFELRASCLLPIEPHHQSLLLIWMYAFWVQRFLLLQFTNISKSPRNVPDTYFVLKFWGMNHIRDKILATNRENYENFVKFVGMGSCHWKLFPTSFTSHDWLQECMKHQ